MPSKRGILDVLTRNELNELADMAGVEVPDRRYREVIIDALVSARRVGLPDLLPELSRDTLKKMCRKLGLDDSGKVKAEIAARLTGGAPTTVKKTASGEKPGDALSKKSGTPGLLDRVDEHAKDGAANGAIVEVQKELWQAAVTLRGSIEPSDYTLRIYIWRANRIWNASLTIPEMIDLRWRPPWYSLYAAYVA